MFRASGRNLKCPAPLITKGVFVMEAFAVSANVVSELKGSGKHKQRPPHGTGAIFDCVEWLCGTVGGRVGVQLRLRLRLWGRTPTRARICDHGLAII